MKRISILLSLTLCCLSAMAQTDEKASNERKFTIHTIGDSTMADKDISKGSPERGWGMLFENFVNKDVKVMNYALNGRSTKSFIDEGVWDKVEKNMQSGDYLFIEFGHNDEKVNKPSVYAPAWSTYQDNLRRFIKTAKEKGVTPVLFTPVARRHFADNQFIRYTHGDYPAAMKAVAEETGTVIIDMESATADWISAAGDEESRKYFVWVKKGECAAFPDGKEDNTHSNAAGARRNCEIVCDSLKARVPELAKYLVHYDIVVDQNGRGDFLTVQDAINAVPDYLDMEKTLLIKAGTYRERVFIPASKKGLKIIGEGADKTVIVYDNCAKKLWPGTKHEMGTPGSATMFVDANDVCFQDLTIRNDAGPNNVAGQALALLTNGDRIAFWRCRIEAHQDTIYTYGRYGDNGSCCRSYYRDCYIEGTTDFIFGPGVCLLENCEIHSKRNSYITAASTFKGEEFGYVFLNCRLTADEGINKVHLGRPWRDYARVVYINCFMDKHIVAAGWHNWKMPHREKTAYYAEYGSYGPGANPKGRVSWSHQLNARKAAKYTIENIFRGAGTVDGTGKVKGTAGGDDLWIPECSRL